MNYDDDYDEEDYKGKTIIVNVGDTLRQLRESRNLDIVDFSKRTWLSPKEVELIESSKTLPVSLSDLKYGLADYINEIYDFDLLLGPIFLTHGLLSQDEFDELSKIVNFNGTAFDEFSILASKDKLQELETDERFAPYGIKGLGYINDKYKVNSRLTAPFINGYITSPIEYKYVLPSTFFDYVTSNKDISKKTINYLLSPRAGKYSNPWYVGIPHLIHGAYVNKNKKLYEQLVIFAEQNNKKAFENERDEYSLDSVHGLYLGRYGVIGILDETLDAALDLNDIENMERLNSINLNIINHMKPKNIYYGTYKESELYRARISSNSKLSEIDKHILKCLNYGILDIGELVPEKWQMSDGQPPHRVKKLKVDFVAENLDELSKTIEKYPVTLKDAINGYIDRGEWEQLEQYRSEEFLKSLKGKKDGVTDAFLECLDSQEVQSKSKNKARELFNNFFTSYGVTCGYDRRLIPPIVKDKNVIWFDSSITDLYKDPYEKIKDSEEAKNARLHDLLLEYKMFIQNDELSKDYFLKELENKNYRDLLIDLCVRLETNLDNKYGEDATLMENLKKYCGPTGEYDGINDLEIYGDEGAWNLLSKLVRCRNNEVHRKTSDESMTYDELIECIDNICSM